MKIFHGICALNAEPDELEFDTDHIRGERIREDAECEGIRVIIPAQLGKTRLNIQIDIGHADVITPAPEKLDCPTILDLLAPHLYGYPSVWETFVLRQVQSMAASFERGCHHII